MKISMKMFAVVLPVACGVAFLPFVVGGGGEGRVEIIGPGWMPGESQNAAPGGALPSSSVLGVGAAIPVGVPIGTVVGWLKTLTNTPALPPDWVECNGQRLDLPGSPYSGQSIPDLNGAREQPARFLRGATESGSTGGSESHRHGSVLLNRSGPKNVNVAAWTHAQHLPPYYEVVWVMKVL